MAPDAFGFMRPAQPGEARRRGFPRHSQPARFTACAASARARAPNDTVCYLLLGAGRLPSDSISASPGWRLRSDGSAQRAGLTFDRRTDLTQGRLSAQPWKSADGCQRVRMLRSA
jgi:hypothetical protein